MIAAISRGMQHFNLKKHLQKLANVVFAPRKTAGFPGTLFDTLRAGNMLFRRKKDNDRPFTIFIVEDNSFYSFFLNELLREYGNFSISTFETAENCLQVMDTRPDLVIQDYYLDRGMNGGEAFRIMREKYPEVPVIMLSGQKDVQVAADLMHQGLYNYIEKRDKKAFDKLKNSIIELSDR